MGLTIGSGYFFSWGPTSGKDRIGEKLGSETLLDFINVATIDAFCCR